LLRIKSKLRAILSWPRPASAQERRRTLKGDGVGIIQAVTVNNALANPRRRHIMAMLETGERSHNEITGEIGTSISGYHMDLLESAGLIEQRNESIEMTKFARMLANPNNGRPERSRESFLIEPIEITNFSHLLPCPGNPSRFRISAKISPRPGNAIELLREVFPNSLYSERMKALIIPLKNTIVTMYSSGNLSMVMLKSEEEAWEILEDLRRIINQSIILRLRGKSRFDHMEINRRLPHTNCGECGEKSCYYFAVKLAYDWNALNKCKPLMEKRYSKKLIEIKDLINCSRVILNEDPDTGTD
jgi:ArsR family metal-binding transcriptional regulator